MQNGVSEKFSQAFYYIAQLLSGLIVAFYYGWKMTLVLLAASPVMVLAGSLSMIFISSSSKKSQKRSGSANELANEAISGVRTVHSFNSSDSLLSHYSELIHGAAKEGIKSGHWTGIAGGTTYLLIFAIYALGMWYGGTLVNNDEMNPGDVLIVFFAVMVGMSLHLLICPSDC
jgi:ABC-type bacteriocin/lantibiotic exporter with double-glycine peptidase domain